MGNDQPATATATESWPAMAHVSAAAATGHPDYCHCIDCEAHRSRYGAVTAEEDAINCRGPHAREAIRRSRIDLPAMQQISDEWDKLSDAGKRFMLSALSAGMKEADYAIGS